MAQTKAMSNGISKVASNKQKKTWNTPLMAGPKKQQRLFWAFEGE